MQATGSVDDQHVDIAPARRSYRRARNRQRVLIGARREELGLDLGRQCLELIDRSRTINVGADHHDLLFFAFPEQPCKLGDTGRLARPLQTRHQNHGRRLGGEIELFVLLTHQADQFIVDDLYQDLTRCQAAQHVFTQGPDAHLVDEILDHRQRDIGLQQGHAHLAQSILDVVLADPALAANLL